MKHLKWASIVFFTFLQTGYAFQYPSATQQSTTIPPQEITPIKKTGQILPENPQPVPPCNHNYLCEFYENTFDCPQDCLWELYGSSPDNLHYFAYRDVTGDLSVAMPKDPVTGRTRIDFSFVLPYPHLNAQGTIPKLAAYVALQSTGGAQTVLDLIPASNNYVGNFIVPPLTLAQTIAWMGSRTQIPAYALYYKNILEIDKADHGGSTSLKVGVKMKSDGTHEVDVQGNVLNDPAITGYSLFQSGGTVVWNKPYNNLDKQRLYLNFNCPSVIKYLKQLAEKTAVRKATNFLVWDNCFYHHTECYNYLPGSTLDQKVETYALAHVQILSYLYQRGYQLILNGGPFRGNTTGGDKFAQVIFNNGAYFYGNLFERRYDEPCNGEECRFADLAFDPVSKYQYYMDVLQSYGKKAFFSSNDCYLDEGVYSEKAWKTFLWIQLIAKPGMTYLAIDPNIVQAGQPDYWWYKTRLGQALGNAYWNTTRQAWIREFDSGLRIVFESGGASWKNWAVPQELYLERF